MTTAGIARHAQDALARARASVPERFGIAPLPPHCDCCPARWREDSPPVRVTHGAFVVYVCRPCADRLAARSRPVRPGKPPKVATGRPRFHRLRIMSSFDEDTFAQIRDKAVADGCSFNEALCVLVELGLETLATEQ